MALIAGETLEHALTSTATLKHSTTALWKADDFADGLYTFGIGLGARTLPSGLVEPECRPARHLQEPAADGGHEEERRRPRDDDHGEILSGSNRQ